MTNAFYNATGTPGDHAHGSSASMRAELVLIAAGFDKLPTLSGNALELLRVNAGATGVETTPTIDAIPIGGTTPAAGAFTTLSATGAVVLGDAAGDAVTIAGSAITWSGNPTHSGNHTISGSLTVTGATVHNGATTLGDTGADALTINSSAVATPNGLNFDSSTLVLDAANNRVGVGLTPVTYKFEALGTIAARSATSNAALLAVTDSADSAARNWALASNHLVFGDFALLQSNALGGNPVSAGTRRLYVSPAGEVSPGGDNTQSLGTAALRWADVRSVLGTFTGAITSTLSGTGYTQTSANVGGINELIVQNTGNSGTSNARLLVSASSGTGGDAFTTYNASAVNWSAGIDRSAGSSYVISISSGVGTGNVFEATTAGAVTFPNASGVTATGPLAANGGVTGALTGNASTATALQNGRTISITGDLAYTSPSFDGSSNVAAAGTLATVNANVGSFGSSTAIPTFTVNAKGLITAASTAAVVAPAGTLTGATLAAGVTASSLTSLGNLTGLTMAGNLAFDANNTRAIGASGVRASTVFSVLGNFSGAITASGGVTGDLTGNVTGNVTGSSGSTTGNAATATVLQTARTINGTSFNGSANITVTAAAGTLTGATLAAGVTASSLTSVGTLGSLTVSGTATFDGGVTLGDAAGDTITVTGTPAGQVVSGTWTPTVTAVANVTGTPTVTATRYTRIGSVVTFSFFLSFDPTSATTTTRVGVSLPIASAFTTPNNAAGVGNQHLVVATGSPGTIAADDTNDRLEFFWFSGADVGVKEFYCVGQYTII